MPSDEMEEVIEEQAEKVPEDVPLEVKVVNKKEVSQYDDKDDEEYDDLSITDKEIEEFKDGDSPSK